MQETGVVSIGHIAKKLHGTLNDRTCITLGSSQTYLSLSFDQSERYDWLKIWPSTELHNLKLEDKVTRRTFEKSHVWDHL